MKIISVFCSSKINLALIYITSVINLISKIDPTKFTIAYGGGTIGLMGTVRKTWLENNGKIISSNLDKFVEKEVIDDYIYDNLTDRQKKLIELGDIYLVLPGGYGTHYELLDVITNNDIGMSSKSIFVLNTNNIYENMLIQLKKLTEEGFITNDLQKIKLYITDDVDKIAELINKLGIYSEL